ncbi:hypothetical protein ACFW7O_38895, partial [Streptomyces diastatochromogenes]
VPPQGVPAPTGRRARRDSGAPQAALPPALPAAGTESAQPVPVEAAEASGNEQPTGRRRRALAAAAERAAAQEAGARTVFALPPAEADRSPDSADTATGAGVAVAPGAHAQSQVPGQVRVSAPGVPDDGRHDAVPLDQAEDHTPPQPHPTNGPTGRRRRAVAHPGEAVEAAAPVATAPGAPGQAVPALPAQATPVPGAPTGAAGQPSVVAPAGVVAQPGGAAQAAPGQPAALPSAALPNAAVPTQGTAGQVLPVPPGQPVPAQVAPGQPVPAQPAPAQPVPAQLAPALPVPAQPVPAQAPQGQQPPAAPAPAAQATPAAGTPAVPQSAQPLPAEAAAGQVAVGQSTPAAGTPAAAVPQQWAGADDTSGAGVPAPRPGTPLPPAAAQPLPAEAAGPAVDPNSTQGRAISVRTLGQGVPFARQAAQVQQPTATPPPHPPGGSGRRRKLGTPPDPAGRQEQQPEQAARPHPPAEPLPAQPSLAGQSRLDPATEGAGRSYAIGAPDANAAEGPEPLDGPGGAIEVADTPRPQPLDDELPPEPLDNPRRLLVWPAPDVTTQQALSDRGYRPVIVHSREEVDAQIAAFPAALFVDPLTGPITRTALQSLRQAAVAAEVPVLVTAGLGQATREAAYGADPAVLLKALAPRDSEQHPPRVLLIEEHAEIALALTSTLERRGMQVARAASDNDAVTLAGQLRPNLVVMDLMQVHRRQAGYTGIIDWLRANGQLNRTPLVVYTAAVDPADLPRLASGETVLFLAERSTSNEVQSRIVDLLARIGTN